MHPAGKGLRSMRSVATLISLRWGMDGRFVPSSPSLSSGAARRMVGGPLRAFGHPPPQAGEGRSSQQQRFADVTISQPQSPAVPSPACGGGCPVRGGRGFPSMRSVATLISLRWGTDRRVPFLPPLFYPAALRAGWLKALSRPSATLPRKRGREGSSQELAPLVIAKAAPLVIARSAATWQSSSFPPARSAADFLIPLRERAL
jgi:hypothetical protein